MYDLSDNMCDRIWLAFVVLLSPVLLILWLLGTVVASFIGRGE